MIVPCRVVALLASALLLGTAACQSAAGPTPVASDDSMTGTAQFHCGPTDDLELRLDVSSPGTGTAAAHTLTAILGSELWSTLARGQRRLELTPGASTQWCQDGRCTTPTQVTFEFDRVGLQDGDTLSGKVEIRSGQQAISLPLRAQVERTGVRCG